MRMESGVWGLELGSASPRWIQGEDSGLGLLCAGGRHAGRHQAAIMIIAWILCLRSPFPEESPLFYLFIYFF